MFGCFVWGGGGVSKKKTRDDEQLHMSSVEAYHNFTNCK